MTSRLGELDPATRAQVANWARNPGNVFLSSADPGDYTYRVLDEPQWQQARYLPKCDVPEPRPAMFLGIPSRDQRGLPRILEPVSLTLPELLAASPDSTFDSNEDPGYLAKSDTVMCYGRLRFPNGEKVRSAFPAGDTEKARRHFANFIACELLSSVDSRFPCSLLTPRAERSKNIDVVRRYRDFPESLKARFDHQRDILLAFFDEQGWQGLTKMAGLETESQNLYVYSQGIGDRMLEPLGGATGFSGLEPEQIQLPFPS